MSLLRAFLARIHGLFGRAAADRDLAEEFAAHLDMAAAEYERRGLTPAEARRRARLDAGNLTGAAERYRERRGFAMLDATMGDLRFALRSLRRTPGVSAAAVVTLALGIAAATTVFSAAYGILLKPLPVHAPSRIVALWGDNPTHQPEHFPLSSEEIAAFSHETRYLSSTAGYDYMDPEILGAEIGDVGVGDLRVSFVTGDFFRVLGVHPLRGRLIEPSDDRYGARRVGVISDAYWHREFDANPAVIGTTIRIVADTVSVVGVAPPGLDLPSGTDLWEATLRDSTGRHYAFMNLVGRLKPGASVAQEKGEFGAFLHRPTEPISPARKALGVPLGPIVQPIMDVVVGAVAPTLHIVILTVVLLVLVTCVNVTNLLLVRAVSRRREFTGRAALGASGTRLALQLLIEGGVLAAVGGLLGIMAAWWGVRAFVALAPATIPRLGHVSMDGRVLAVSVSIVLAVALIVGLLPSVLGERLSLADHLKDRGNSDAGPASHRSRSLLVGLQVAVAVLALAAAGLVGRSFQRLTQVNLGFEPDHILFVRLGVVGKVSPNQILGVVDRMLPRLKALPGVRNAAELYSAPFQATGFDLAYSLPRDAGKSGIVHPWLDGTAVSPGFFRTLGIPILAGRAFSSDDRRDRPHVAIVDAKFARQSWPGETPLGKRVYALDDTFTVVGVAGPTRYRNLVAPRMTFYIPFHQAVSGFWPRFLAVRTAAEPDEVAQAVRTAIRQADSRFFVSGVMPMSQQLFAATAAPRLAVVLLGIFAVAILFLTVLGV